MKIALILISIFCTDVSFGGGVTLVPDNKIISDMLSPDKLVSPVPLPYFGDITLQCSKGGVDDSEIVKAIPVFNGHKRKFRKISGYNVVTYKFNIKTKKFKKQKDNHFVGCCGEKMKSLAESLGYGKQECKKPTASLNSSDFEGGPGDLPSGEPEATPMPNSTPTAEPAGAGTARG